MLYRLLADLVVAVHVSFMVFVAVGALLAWRWAWLTRLHAPSVAWAVAGVAVGLSCPLTSLEKLLREKGGEAAYAGGFVDRYIEGTVYPDSLTPALWAVAGVVVAAGYWRLGVSRCRGGGGGGDRWSTRGRRGAGSRPRTRGGTPTGR